jgi:hypothetical protein
MGEGVSALLLVVVCIGAGALVARLPHPPGLVAGLNWWVLNIALPPLILLKVTALSWSIELLWPAAAMWLVFFGAWLTMAGMGRVCGWTRGETGALVLTCGLGNTAFVGYPMIEALRGDAALGVAVVADQLGTFLLLSTFGLVAAAWHAGTRVAPAAIARRVLLFPAFIALALAALLRLLDLQIPETLAPVLARLGDTLTPLALFSVGLQLQLHASWGDVGRMGAGLGWKMLAAPALVWAVLAWRGVSPPVADIAVLQAAMAPMITAGILAQQHGLAPALANRIVGVGIVLSLVSVPLVETLL